jgi:hypothetical protein
VPLQSGTPSFTGASLDIKARRPRIGNEALQKAASSLGRRISQRPEVTRLLQRDYYQVAWSQACYAVAEIKDNEVPAGTGWTVKMFAQLHPGNHNLYVFDQMKNAWFRFNGNTWDNIDSPPRPSGIWAGIGSRDLQDNGRDAIRKLMGC